ncbi:uncharacterized protein V1516DRAFT_682630 [Lipomyces oligophaga]|uniref:uncharacterized protein n=1 Tax=Lipomyces oligophaga TaxID=45792 RepID=UPI0034CD76F9
MAFHSLHSIIQVSIRSCRTKTSMFSKHKTNFDGNLISKATPKSTSLPVSDPLENLIYCTEISIVNRNGLTRFKRFFLNKRAASKLRAHQRSHLKVTEKSKGIEYVPNESIPLIDAADDHNPAGWTDVVDHKGKSTIRLSLMKLVRMMLHGKCFRDDDQDSYVETAAKLCELSLDALYEQFMRELEQIDQKPVGNMLGVEFEFPTLSVLDVVRED